MLPALARQPAAVHRLGYLSGRASASEAANVEGLRRGMRDLGYVEGRDFTLETRFAEGQVERSPELAAELVRFPVELIVAVGIVPPRAAKDASNATRNSVDWLGSAPSRGSRWTKALTTGAFSHRSSFNVRAAVALLMWTASTRASAAVAGSGASPAAIITPAAVGRNPRVTLGLDV